MGSSKRNLLTSILLLVVMGVFAVLTIFIVVDAINKKYYNDIKVEYEVQEESPNIILTFARNEGSNFSTDNTKVMLNEEKTKFRIDGTVPEIQNGVVTNLDDLTSSDGREFYFFSTNSSFIDPQEDPENPDFIFSETDSRYYVSTEDNPIWYDVPKSSENLTLYSVFLTPNVHNSDFANAPLNTITNAIVSHDVVDLPREAFGGSGSAPSVLTTILLPENLQNIGEYAFFYCSSLETVIFGDNSQLVTIGDYSFRDCSSLTSITIPSGVTSIWEGAFDNCSSLETVYFGENSQLTSIGEFAFWDCSSLETVDFGDNSQLTSIEGSAFENCGRLETVNFGENSKLTSIGSGAFYDCSSLTSITIPDSVTSIGSEAFADCSSLSSIIIPDSVTSMGDYVFSACSSLKSITIPDSVTSIGELVFYDCSSLTSITIPDSVTSIGNETFYGCGSLKTVDFGDNSQLTSIGDNAFEYCSSLTSITISESVTSIGSYAFRYCYKLVEVYDLTGSEGLNITVGSEDNGYVGYYAVEIKKENIPTGIYYASTNNEYMMYVDLKENHYLVDYNGQGGDITLLTFEDRTYSINTYAFGENYNITSVKIPSSVTSIGEYAFYSCDSLTSITIPDSVTSIGSSAFWGCNSLTSIIIPEGVTSIGNEAFSFCDRLTSITIPESVTSIGSYAFQFCSSLTSITIPEGVTSIGSYAFRFCNNLTIYCEVSSRPSGWSSSWNYSNRPVYWGGEWEYVGGVPTPIESGVEGVGYSGIGEDFGLGFREEISLMTNERGKWYRI